MFLNTFGCNNIAIGCAALYNACGTASATNNIGIGHSAGCSITTGIGNVIFGSYISCAAAACTFVVQAGNCVRLVVDDTGLQINGSAFTGGSSSASGGSGQFNTSISNQIGYSVTDKLFDPTGTSGALTNTNYIVVGSGTYFK